MTSRKEAGWIKRCLRREVKAALAARTGEAAEYKVQTKVWEVGLPMGFPPSALHDIPIPGESYVAAVRITDAPLDLGFYLVMYALPRPELRKYLRNAADLKAREFMRRQKAMMRSNAPKEENNESFKPI